MTFYEKSVKSALTLLKKRGQSIAISRTVNTFDPVGSSASPAVQNG